VTEVAFSARGAVTEVAFSARGFDADRRRAEC
jgi:hypothetical protein